VDLVRCANRGISTADLADKMGLTRAAVTVTFNDLILNGIILRTESRSTASGCQTVTLEINPNPGWIAAPEMSKHKIQFGKNINTAVQI